MKVNIKYSQKEEGMLKKKTVYRADAKVELEPEEQTIVDAYPEILEETVLEKDLGGDSPKPFNFGYFIRDYASLHSSERKLSVKGAVAEFKDRLSTVKNHILILGDDSTEETFDV